MTDSNEPRSDQWAAYDETQIAPVSLNKQEAPAPGDVAASDAPAVPHYENPAPAPAYQDPYAQPQYPVVPPYPAQPQYPVAQPQSPWVPQPGQFFQAPPPINYGPAPLTAQTSAILATVFGGLLVAGCWTTLIGIAPLVLGIVGLNKANSVGRLWGTGQFDAARYAAEESRRYANWAWISMAIGFTLGLLLVLVLVIANP
ncbi:hypothetical protein nbrc107696_16230 [Gordonia spumicola]|uniref:Interferon-induced transmembrane protein n=1 Tax=Gordonia spumicola TaxID=589161 RepID=A0A7I9V796_9ACTN|nr:hypothetical protein [Gordonia spumicola]GEE01177.1 hypothetical protein nbrc107696_16230 [Gordonia spumicola]